MRPTQATYHQRRQRTLRREKKCIWCRVSAVGAGHVLCGRCRDDNKVRSQIRAHDMRAAGLCVRCTAPSPDTYYCADCGAERNARRAERGWDNE